MVTGDRYVIRRGKVRGAGEYMDRFGGWTAAKRLARVFKDCPAANLTARQWARNYMERWHSATSYRLVRLVRRSRP